MADEKKAATVKDSVRQATTKAGTGAAQAKQEDGMTTATTGPQASSSAIQSGAACLDSDKAVAGAKPAVSHMLGEAAWLLSLSPTHKHFAIGDLEWPVMPAILLERFRVFHGDRRPLGFALWARLSEDAEARLTGAVAAGDGARFRSDDRKSGDRLWLVELVAPFATPDNRLMEATVADLVQNVFEGRPFRLHSLDPVTGRREVKEIGK